MTPRERVVKTLSRQEPDKIPIDCGGTICSTMTRTAHNAVKTHLGIRAPDEPITHPVLDTVVPCDELLKRFQVDFKAVRMRPPSNIGADSADKQGFSATSAAVVIQPHGHTFSDEFGTVWQKADNDYAPVKHAYANATLAELKKAKWPDPYDPGRVEGLQEEARRLCQTTDLAIVGDIMCGGPFEQALWLRGYTQFLEDLYVDPQFARALLDRITDLDLGFWDAYLSAIGQHVQVVAQGDDLGMQSQEYISPELYKKFIFPCHQRMFSFIRAKTDAKIFLHSCGCVRDLIPYFIEAGIDALNPVQCGAARMDIRELKREFGREVSFWGGGFDVQHKLGDDTSLDAIRQAVRESIEILAPGGGFVFACTHNIQHEAPAEKTLAIYDTAVACRDYHR
jgi:uroporphyrinogen decarboxylase